MAGYTDELLETLDTKAKGKPFNASKYFNYYSFDIMGVSFPVVKVLFVSADMPRGSRLWEIFQYDERWY